MMYWEDLEEGQPLPAITYELTLARLVSFVRATGLFDYIHFDRDYARSVGMRDAFMATPHILGLISRLMTDWSGPGGQPRSINLEMFAPCCRNDILHVTGTVGRKYRDADGTPMVELVDLIIAHDLAPAAVAGSATMALPSRSSGDVPVRLVEDAIAPPLPGPDVPAFVRPYIGTTRPGPHRGATALTAHEVALWCECLEDWNPAYRDADHALAPPGLSWFFGAGMGVSAGIGHGKPGVSVPAPVLRNLTGLTLLSALREDMMEENTPFTLDDYPEAVVRRVQDDYFAPLRPGDRVHDRFCLTDCSRLKRTRLGEGHFIAFDHSFHNQHGLLIRRSTLTLFHFRP